jgi:hypothetical protein
MYCATRPFVAALYYLRIATPRTCWMSTNAVSLVCGAWRAPLGIALNRMRDVCKIQKRKGHEATAGSHSFYILMSKTIPCRSNKEQNNLRATPTLSSMY